MVPTLAAVSFHPRWLRRRPRSYALYPPEALRTNNVFGTRVDHARGTPRAPRIWHTAAIAGEAP